MRPALAALLGASLLAACGGDGPADLKTAGERTQERGSARLEIRGVEREDGHAEEIACTGVVDYAARRYRFECADQGEFIVVGNDVFLRPADASDKRWERYPLEEDSAFALFDPTRALGWLASGGRATERIGDEDVRGAPAVHYRLTVDREATGITTGPGETVPVDVWVDADDLVRRISVDDRDASATFEFYDFGVDVDIEPPPADEVVDMDAERIEPAPCGHVAEPITVVEALTALKQNGFSAKAEEGCPEGVAAVLGNGEGEAVRVREGIVSCFLRERPEADAPHDVVRRGVDGGDAQVLLENFVCMILADSPQGEEKVQRLVRAFEQLDR